MTSWNTLCVCVCACDCARMCLCVNAVCMIIGRPFAMCVLISLFSCDIVFLCVWLRVSMHIHTAVQSDNWWQPEAWWSHTPWCIFTNTGDRAVNLHQATMHTQTRTHTHTQTDRDTHTLTLRHSHLFIYLFSLTLEHFFKLFAENKHCIAF